MVRPWTLGTCFRSTFSTACPVTEDNTGNGGRDRPHASSPCSRVAPSPPGHLASPGHLSWAPTLSVAAELCCPASSTEPHLPGAPRPGACAQAPSAQRAPPQECGSVLLSKETGWSVLRCRLPASSPCDEHGAGSGTAGRRRKSGLATRPRTGQDPLKGRTRSRFGARLHGDRNAAVQPPPRSPVCGGRRCRVTWSA